MITVSKPQYESCNFCTEGGAVAQLQGQSPHRTLQVRICRACLVELRRLTATLPR
jgi:hypothetical protein